MKKKFLATLTLLVLAFGILPFAGAQQDEHVLFMDGDPYPGSQLTFQNASPHELVECFANDTPLPNIPPDGSITYTIPPSTPVGSGYEVWCQSTAEGSPNTNILNFVLGEAPNTDGDNLPDNEDECPQERGPDWNNGCPQGQLDHDGDGTVDANDECPEQSGPSWNAGCPTEEEQPLAEGEDQEPAPPTPTPTPAYVAPGLPESETCYIATQSNVPVNVREEPVVASGNVVGAMDPNEVYEANARREMEGETWFRLPAFDGWAAGWVTRGNDACAGLQGDGGPASVPTIPDWEQSAQNPDLDEVFGACPDVIENVRGLPVYAIGALADADDSCSMASLMLEQLVFGDRFSQPALPDEVAGPMAGACPGAFVSLSYRFERVRAYNIEYFRALRELVANMDDLCAFAEALSRGSYVPVLNQLGTEPAAEVFTAMCLPQLHSGQIDSTAQSLLAISHSLEGATCATVRQVRMLGTLKQSQQNLANRLQNECGFSYIVGDPSILTLLQTAIAYDVDYADGLMPDLCASPFASLESAARDVRDMAEDFDVPGAMTSCPATAKLLQNHGSTLTATNLIRIIHAPDACGAAFDYMANGILPPLPYDFRDALNSCLPEGITGEMLASNDDYFQPVNLLNTEPLPDDRYTSDNRFFDPALDWNTKIGLVDRAPGRICSEPAQPMSLTFPEGSKHCVRVTTPKYINRSGQKAYLSFTLEYGKRRSRLDYETTSVQTNEFTHALAAGESASWVVTSWITMLGKEDYGTLRLMHQIESDHEWDDIDTQGKEDWEYVEDAVCERVGRTTKSPEPDADVRELGEKTCLQVKTFGIRNKTSSPIDFKFWVGYTLVDNTGQRQIDQAGKVSPTLTVPPDGQYHYLLFNSPIPIKRGGYFDLSWLPQGSIDIANDIAIRGDTSIVRVEDTACSQPGVVRTGTLGSAPKPPQLCVEATTPTYQNTLSQPVKVRYRVVYSVGGIPDDAGHITAVESRWRTATVEPLKTYISSWVLAVTDRDSVRFGTLRVETQILTGGDPIRFNWGPHGVREIDFSACTGPESTGEGDQEDQDGTQIGDPPEPPEEGEQEGQTGEPPQPPGDEGQGQSGEFSELPPAIEGQEMLDELDQIASLVSSFEEVQLDEGQEGQNGQTGGPPQPPQAGSGQDQGGRMVRGSQPIIEPTRETSGGKEIAYAGSPQNTEEAVYGLLPGENAGAFEGGLAVFQAEDEQGSDIYLIEAGEIKPLTEMPTERESEPALGPDGKRVAYLSITEAGDVRLLVHHIERGVTVTVLEDSERWTIESGPLAWSPDGSAILLTLTNAETETAGIYKLVVGTYTEDDAPELLVEDATAPAFAPNGRLVAFERAGENGMEIHVLSLKTGRVMPVVKGQNCMAPAFGRDSLALYFLCDAGGERILYRHDMQGTSAVDTGEAQPITNPAPGPGVSMLSFDDGVTIYAMSGENIMTLVHMENKDALKVDWPGP